MNFRAVMVFANAPNVLVTSLSSFYVVARLPHPPIILRGPSNQTSYEGETVKFECRILSDLQEHVKWLKHYMVNGSYVNDNGTAYVTALTVSPSTAFLFIFVHQTQW